MYAPIIIILSFVGIFALYKIGISVGGKKGWLVKKQREMIVKNYDANKEVKGKGLFLEFDTFKSVLRRRPGNEDTDS